MSYAAWLLWWNSLNLYIIIKRLAESKSSILHVVYCWFCVSGSLKTKALAISTWLLPSVDGLTFCQASCGLADHADGRFVTGWYSIASIAFPQATHSWHDGGVLRCWNVPVGGLGLAPAGHCNGPSTEQGGSVCCRIKCQFRRQLSTHGIAAWVTRWRALWTLYKTSESVEVVVILPATTTALTVASSILRTTQQQKQNFHLMKMMTS